MLRSRVRTQSWKRAGAFGLVTLVAGCGYAKRTEMQQELARVQQEMRAEMQAADQALESRMDSRMQALERDLQALRDEFRVTIQELENALAFNVPVHFEFDRADVRPQDQQVLDRFARVVREYYPTALITVEGFTDPAGSREYNLRLGKARADAVRDYLVANGLPADRIRTVSYGAAEERLISNQSGPGEAGMENRRVSLVIDFSGASPVVTSDEQRPTT